jgi:hypothetical protein
VLVERCVALGFDAEIGFTLFAQESPHKSEAGILPTSKLTSFSHGLAVLAKLLWADKGLTAWTTMGWTWAEPGVL